jgi:hypothetical protein
VRKREDRLIRDQLPVSAVEGSAILLGLGEHELTRIRVELVVAGRVTDEVAAVRPVDAVVLRGRAGDVERPAGVDEAAGVCGRVRACPGQARRRKLPPRPGDPRTARVEGPALVGNLRPVPVNPEPANRPVTPELAGSSPVAPVTVYASFRSN